MAQSYVKEWESCTNLNFRFVEPNTKNAHIRITFWTKDEAPEPGYRGHWSYLGTDCTTKVKASFPSMNLDLVAMLQDCANKKTEEDDRIYLFKYMKATILHEFGHALGFIHEHLRADRPFEIDEKKAIDDNLKNWGWSPEKTKHAISGVWKMNSLQHSAFDVKSIMIYYFNKETLKQVPGKLSEVEESFDLSIVDRQWAAIIYPLSKPPKPTK